MSSRGVDEAIERIARDNDFAREVLAEPDRALGPFDLTSDERSSVADALRRDVDAAFGEVTGFMPTAVELGSVQLNNLIQVARFQGTFDRAAEQLVLLEMRGQPGGTAS